MAASLSTLLTDERSAQVTAAALDYSRRLFATPTSTGTRLAVQALQGTLPQTTVTAAITGYTHAVLELTRT